MESQGEKAEEARDGCAETAAACEERGEPRNRGEEECNEEEDPAEAPQVEVTL